MSSPQQTTPLRIMATMKLLIQIALGLAAVLAVFTGRWSTLFASLGTLILTFVPQYFAQRAKFRLPLQFELAIVLFVYASIILGEVDNYYERFWWWDVVLHSGSAFAFGFAGFLILYTMYIRGKLKASPFLISIFSFTFGLAIGAVWEIFEFVMDVLFGLNMQKSGLKDTMSDLMVDSLGAGIASSIGYVYLKYKIRDPFDSLINWFLQENPHLGPLKPFASQIKAKKRRRSK
jgi:hypothetical protein